MREPYIVLAIALTACGRIGFDPAAPVDAAHDAALDAAPISLPCNTPVLVSDLPDPSNPRLAGVATATRLGASYISDDSTLFAAGGQLVAFDSLVPSEPGPGLPSYDLVALASAGPTYLGIGLTGGISAVRLYDDATQQPTVAQGVGSPDVITSPDAAVPTGAASGAIYAVAGIHGTNTSVFGIDGANQFAGTVPVGTNDLHVGLASNGTDLVSVNVTTGVLCEARVVALDLSTSGAPVSWEAGNCDQVVAAQLAGRSDILLVSHDMGSNTVEYQLGTINGLNLALGTLAGISSQLGTVEGRAVATPNGYWLTSVRAGHLVAVHITLAGAVDSELDLGASLQPTGHDVVRKNGYAYAIWFANGFRMARLCP